MPITPEQEQLLKSWLFENKHIVPTLVKQQHVDAFTAIFDFIEANANNINQAFPQPFRGEASVELKALYVAAAALAYAGIADQIRSLR